MISNLNQRANILAPTLKPDGGGGFSESWNTIATVWVRVEPLSGSDAVSQDVKQSRVQHRITLRRLAVIAAGQRVVIGARTFRIEDVLDEGPQAALMTLSCEELP